MTPSADVKRTPLSHSNASQGILDSYLAHIGVLSERIQVECGAAPQSIISWTLDSMATPVFSKDFKADPLRCKMDLNDYNKNEDQFLQGFKNIELEKEHHKADEVVAKKHYVEEFLEREWMQNAYSFPIGFGSILQFNPLNVLTVTPFKERLAGISRLRFQEMELTFTVSCSPFVSGLIAATWFPLASSCAQVNGFSHPSVFAWDSLTSTNCTGFTISNNMAHIEMTSRRHILIPLVNGTSMTLRIPFVYFQHWLPCFALNSTFDNFTDVCSSFGSLAFRPIVSPVDCATTPSSDAPVIAVTSKLIGVQVVGLSNHVQSVSGTLSTIADLVKANRWFLGSDSKKVEDVMNAGSTVAEFLGMSNGNNTSDVVASSRNHTLGWSSTQRKVPMDSTGVEEDSKMVLDPRQHGSIPDPLMINSMTCRPVWDSAHAWTTAQAAGAVVGKLNVCPETYYTYASAINTTFGVNTVCDMFKPTPMTGISQFFYFWRGTIKYKIIIVASAMHRGVLKIHWDNSVSGVADSAVGHAGCPSVVIDLDKTREVEIDIPYAAASHWLPCHHMITSTVRPTSGTLSNTADAVYNGIVSMTVVAPLRGPSSSGVSIVVMKSSDDIEFAAPCEPRAEIANLSVVPYIFAQSLTVDHARVAATIEPEISTYPVAIGESVRSIRELLHRATLTYVLTPGVGRGDGGTFSRISKWLLRRKPDAHGFLNDPLSGQLDYVANSVDAVPYNYGGNFLLDCFSTAFLGWKGAIKYRIVPLESFCSSSSMISLARSFTSWAAGIRGNVGSSNPMEEDLGGEQYHSPYSNRFFRLAPRLLEGGTVAIKGDPLMVEAADYTPLAFNFTNMYDRSSYEIDTNHQYSNASSMFGPPDMVEVTSVSQFLTTPGNTDGTSAAGLNQLGIGVPLAVFTSAGTSFNVLEFIGFPCLFFSQNVYTFDLQPADI